jgi:hypothetical protein
MIFAIVYCPFLEAADYEAKVEALFFCLILVLET